MQTPRCEGKAGPFQNGFGSGETCHKRRLEDLSPSLHAGTIQHEASELGVRGPLISENSGIYPSSRQRYH